jgi:hypothetical protein
VQRRPRLRRKKAGTPIAAGEIDRFLEERRLVEGYIEFERGRARERGFGEQKIAAASAAANAKVAGPDAEPGERLSDRVCGDRFLVRRKARLLSRPGASIMWPLNNTTLRGVRSFGSAMRPAAPRE